MENKTSNSKLIILAVLVFVVSSLVFSLYYLGKQGSSDKQISDTTGQSVPNPQNPSIVSPTQISGTTYHNEKYGISFFLNDNERVVECPNVNEFNDNIALWIVQGPKPNGIDPQTECATEGSPNALIMSKKSEGPQTIAARLEMLKSPGNDYVLTSSPVEVSGVTGVRVVGARDKNLASPLPETIDQMIFEKDGAIYVVPNLYDERNFLFTR